MTIDDAFSGEKNSCTDDLHEIWDDFNEEQISELILYMHQQCNSADDIAALEKGILKELDQSISAINEFNYPVSDETNCTAGKRPECPSQIGAEPIPPSERDQKTSSTENQHRLFECVPCGVAYRHKASLQRHERKSCSARKKSPANGKQNKLLKQTVKWNDYRHSDFSCKKCSRQFNSLRSLQNHSRVHSLKRLRFVNKKRKSTKVDKKFVSDQTIFQCIPCGVAYRNKFSLQRHERESCRTAEKMTDFSCKKCSREFNSSRSLHNHSRIHSSKRLRFVAKKKRSTQVVKKFVEGTDAVRAIYSCSICSKQFNTKFSLRGHKRYHSHSKIFDCTLCTKSYTFKAYFNKHMKSHELSFQ